MVIAGYCNLWCLLMLLIWFLLFHLLWGFSASGSECFVFAFSLLCCFCILMCLSIACFFCFSFSSSILLMFLAFAIHVSLVRFPFLFHLLCVSFIELFWFRFFFLFFQALFLFSSFSLFDSICLIPVVIAYGNGVVAHCSSCSLH